MSRHRADETSLLREIWTSVSPYLTSQQRALEALKAVLPCVLDVTSLELYLLGEEGDSLRRVISWQTNGTIEADCLSGRRTGGHSSDPMPTCGPQDWERGRGASDRDAFIAVGEGVCGYVAQTGRVCNIPDVTRESRSMGAGQGQGGSELAVPLWVTDAHEADIDVGGEARPMRASEARTSTRHVLGVLDVRRDRTAAFSPADELKIASVAREIAVLLDYTLRYSRLEQAVRESECQIDTQTQELRFERDRVGFLYHVTQEMTRTLDLDRVLNRTLARVSKALGVRQGSILLLDQESGHLIYRAVIGRSIRLPKGGKRTRYKRGIGLGGWVLEHNEYAIITGLDEDPRWDIDPQKKGQSESVLAVPLSSEGEVLGVMLLFHPEPDYFNQDHVALAMAAANHITVAVKNSEMYRLIREQAERLGRMLREQRNIASQRMAILASIADGVVVADGQDHIVVANEAARRIMGLAAQGSIGQPTSVLFESCPAKSQEAAHQALVQVAEHPLGAEYIEPISVMLNCGEQIIQASFTPMLDERLDGRQQFAGTVIVLRDVTVEQEIAQAKNEFVSIVSHELRTPMTSIKGYTDLLLKGAVGALSGQQRRFLSIVKSNVDRMADLVSDLLDISRIEAGRLKLEPEPLELTQVVYEVSESLAETIKQRDLTLEIDLAPAIPVVYADRNRVIQVLINLLSNAYRYTPAGGKIIVSVHQVDGTVQVDVADTGIGIPENDQEKIFERFYRADHPLVRQQAGTGLGLPIAKSLIEMHRGRLWLRSEVNKGSTFSFTLPLKDAR